MKYTIIGSGNVGSALARIFARKNIEVGIANSRGPETLESLAKETGSFVRPVSMEVAHQAEIVFLAVPFTAHKEIAATLVSGASAEHTAQTQHQEGRHHREQDDIEIMREIAHSILP